MRRFLKKVPLIVLLLCTLMLWGCKTEKTTPKKIKDLEFTIVDDEGVPDKLKKIIVEKKQAPFKLSYSDEESLYLVVGYGEQPTGGFSITVDELYLTENAIFFGTTLLGPAKGEAVTEAFTYPYIVVKTEYMDKNVVFN